MKRKYCVIWCKLLIKIVNYLLLLIRICALNPFTYFSWTDCLCFLLSCICTTFVKCVPENSFGHLFTYFFRLGGRWATEEAIGTSYMSAEFCAAFNCLNIQNRSKSLFIIVIQGIGKQKFLFIIVFKELLSKSLYLS